MGLLLVGFLRYRGGSVTAETVAACEEEEEDEEAPAHVSLLPVDDGGKAGEDGDDGFIILALLRS